MGLQRFVSQRQSLFQGRLWRSCTQDANKIPSYHAYFFFKLETLVTLNPVLSN
jgi:hypothetical protein